MRKADGILPEVRREHIWSSKNMEKALSEHDRKEENLKKKEKLWGSITISYDVPPVTFNFRASGKHEGM